MADICAICGSPAELVRDGDLLVNHCPKCKRITSVQTEFAALAARVLKLEVQLKQICGKINELIDIVNNNPTK